MSDWEEGIGCALMAPLVIAFHLVLWLAPLAVGIWILQAAGCI